MDEQNQAQQQEPITDLKELDTLMGQMSPEDGTIDGAEVPNNEEAGTGEQGIPAGAQEPPPATQPTAAQQPQNKANQAFAQMRVENNRLAQERQAYEQATERLLESMGIDKSLAKDPNEVLNILHAASLEVQAEEQGVPYELLERLDSLESQNQQQQQQQQVRNATMAYAELQRNYGVDNGFIQQFAVQLRNQGYDPLNMSYQQLEQQLIFQNLPAIIAEAQRSGAQNVTQTTQKARQYSNTPPRSQGVPGSRPTEKKITTPSELDMFFKQNFT